MTYPRVTVLTSTGSSNVYLDAAVELGGDGALTVTDTVGPHDYLPGAWSQLSIG